MHMGQSKGSIDIYKDIHVPATFFPFLRGNWSVEGPTKNDPSSC